MSVRFDAAADELTKTTSIFDYNSPYTIMAWVNQASLPSSGVYNSLWVVGTNISDSYDWVEVTNAAGPTKWSNECQASSAYTEQFSLSGVTADTWYHVTYVRSTTTSSQLYVDGVADGSANTRSVVGRTAATRLSIGGGLGSATDLSNCRIQAVKIWTAALTVAEIFQEMRVLSPRRADTWAFYPMWPGSGVRVLDYSGNGRTLTEVGTVADEDPPPVSWGGVNWLLRNPATAAATIPPGLGPVVEPLGGTQHAAVISMMR